MCVLLYFTANAAQAFFSQYFKKAEPCLLSITIVLLQYFK